MRGLEDPSITFFYETVLIIPIYSNVSSSIFVCFLLRTSQIQDVLLTARSNLGWCFAQVAHADLSQRTLVPCLK